jgi:hypothetical protein
MKSGLGHLLLGIYLILIGLVGVFHVNLGQVAIAVPILALAAGVLLLAGK